MATHSYRDLVVWQKAMDLVVHVYRVCDQLPKSEQFALCDQLKRAAVSVPSNIAEGQKRHGSNELIHFIGIAMGSLAEVETQLLLVQRIYAIDTEELVGEITEIGKMLTALMKAIKSKNQELRTKN